MKKINFLNLGLIYAGSFLGAGYVSGQEIWQFFGKYGFNGIIGVIFTILIETIFGIILILLAKKTGIEEMDKIIVYNNSKILMKIVGIAEVLFIFAIFVIMSAGAGALIKQIFNFNSLIFSGIFCLIVALSAFKGLNGIVKIFSLAVPFLVLSALLISIYSLKNFGFKDFNLTTIYQKNNYINNWFVSSITYVSYNLFASIGIIIPFAKFVEKKSEVIKGIVFGGILLGLMSFSIMFSINTNINSSCYELPMLYVASKLNYIFGNIYAFLLLMGMFGTSLTSLVAVVNYLSYKTKLVKQNTMIIIISIIAFSMSALGFRNLISIIYPIFGYIGFFAIVLIFVHYFKITHERKTKNVSGK